MASACLFSLIVTVAEMMIFGTTGEETLWLRVCSIMTLNFLVVTTSSIDGSNLLHYCCTEAVKSYLWIMKDLLPN